MDTDTLTRLDRIEKQQERIMAFCDGVLKLVTPMVPKLFRPVVHGLADRLHEGD